MNIFWHINNVDTLLSIDSDLPVSVSTSYTTVCIIIHIANLLHIICISNSRHL